MPLSHWISFLTYGQIIKKKFQSKQENKIKFHRWYKIQFPSNISGHYFKKKKKPTQTVCTITLNKCEYMYLIFQSATLAAER